MLALNFVWEIAQLPLYSFGPGTSAETIAFYVVHCTLGDVVIALGAYGGALALTRDPVWPLRQSMSGVATATVAAVAYTAWSEWRNVYVAGNWAYSSLMPTVAGIGLAPLLQWTLLPLTACWVIKRRIRASDGQQRG